VTSILVDAGIFAFPPAYALAVRLFLHLPVRSPWFFVQWATSGFVGAFTAVTAGDWPHVAVWGASGLLGLVLWWRSRRKRRKRSLKALGNKARAVFAAMAANMPRPGPVLRPQGARA
jgi:hypothetical protein